MDLNLRGKFDYAERHFVIDMNESQNSASDEMGLEPLLMEILKSRGKMTTRELEAAVAGHGRRCPDDFVRFLSRLRFKGRIKGEVDRKKGWLWWSED